MGAYESGTPQDDTLHGTDEGDYLFGGGGGSDELYGGGGNDTLRSGDGDDLLYGGSGNDKLLADEGIDTLYGGTGNDMLSGGDGNDELYGGDGSDYLYGGRGDDLLTGGEDADTFVFVADLYSKVSTMGDDTITDFVVGEDLIDLKSFRYSDISSFDDLAISADGDDAIIDLTAYGGGTIRLRNVDPATLSADSFLLPPHPPVRWCGDGDDNEYVGGDADISHRLYGGGGNDTLSGGAGNDIVVGDGGDDVLYGGTGNDRLIGHSGNDAIYGGEGTDTLRGDEGDDTLAGGTGDDFLVGGTGADAFVYGQGDGHDQVWGFTDGEDVIDLRAMSGISGFDDLAIRADGNAAVIDFRAHGGGSIRLENFDAADLDAADFLFHQPSAADSTADGM